MTRVFVGIGSNLGDRAAYMAFARRSLSRLALTRLAAFSGVYETDPVGAVQQGRFLNAVAQLETSLDPYQLLDVLKRTEYLAGREPLTRRKRWGPRTLDLDLLLYGGRVIDSDQLVVPHPLMHKRWFVLRPLADLDPLAMHPRLKVTVQQLLALREGHLSPVGNRSAAEVYNQ